MNPQQTGTQGNKTRSSQYTFDIETDAHKNSATSKYSPARIIAIEKTRSTIAILIPAPAARSRFGPKVNVEVLKKERPP
jgi:hypothetical protein